MQLELHIMWLCVLYMFYMSLARNRFMLSAFIAPHLICNTHFSFVLHVFRSHFMHFNQPLQFYSCGSCWFYVIDVIISRTNTFSESYSFCGIPYNIPPIHHNQHKPHSAHLNMAKTCHPICSFWEMACMYH